MAYAVLTSLMASVSEMGRIGVCVRQAWSRRWARVSMEEGEFVMMTVREFEIGDRSVEIAAPTLHSLIDH
jgi:hypothetical protein